MTSTIEALDLADRRATARGPWQEERLATVLSLLADAGVIPDETTKLTLRWLVGWDHGTAARIVDLILAARRLGVPAAVSGPAAVQVIEAAVDERTAELAHAEATIAHLTDPAVDEVMRALPTKALLDRATAVRRIAVDNLTGRSS